MSVHVLSWAWQQKVGDPGAKLLLLKLADQANDRGECYPSRRSIARDCEMGMSTVTRKIGQLRDAGFLEVDARQREAGSGQTSNLYRLLYLSTPPARIEQGPCSPASTQEPSLEPSTLLKESARPLDPIYQALIGELYPAGAKLTAREQRQVALAAREILGADGTPEQVVDTIKRYRAHEVYGKVAVTAQAVASHWGELAAKPRAAAPCEECGMGGGLHLADCSRIAA